MWPRALWERAKSAFHFKFDNRVLFIHCRGFRETGIVWFWRRQCWAHFSGGSSHAVGLDTGRSASWSLAFSVNKSRVGVELGGWWKFLNAFLQICHISWKKSAPRVGLTGNDQKPSLLIHESFDSWCFTSVMLEATCGREKGPTVLCCLPLWFRKCRRKIWKGDSIKLSTPLHLCLPRPPLFLLFFPHTLLTWWSIFVEMEHWKRNGHLLL